MKDGIVVEGRNSGRIHILIHGLEGFRLFGIQIQYSVVEFNECSVVEYIFGIVIECTEISQRLLHFFG